MSHRCQVCYLSDWYFLQIPSEGGQATNAACILWKQWESGDYCGPVCSPKHPSNHLSKGTEGIPSWWPRGFGDEPWRLTLQPCFVSWGTRAAADEAEGDSNPPQWAGHLRLEKGPCFEFPGYSIRSTGATTPLKTLSIPVRPNKQHRRCFNRYSPSWGRVRFASRRNRSSESSPPPRSPESADAGDLLQAAAEGKCCFSSQQKSVFKCCILTSCSAKRGQAAADCCASSRANYKPQANWWKSRTMMNYFKNGWQNISARLESWLQTPGSGASSSVQVYIQRKVVFKNKKELKLKPWIIHIWAGWAAAAARATNARRNWINTVIIADRDRR